jgi:hypothetical protein
VGSSLEVTELFLLLILVHTKNTLTLPDINNRFDKVAIFGVVETKAIQCKFWVSDVTPNKQYMFIAVYVAKQTAAEIVT